MRTPDEVRRTYDRLTAALDRRPLPDPGGFVLDGNALREITRVGLYLDGSFPSTAELWQEVAAAVSGSALTFRGAAVGPLPVDCRAPVDRIDPHGREAA
ncbi:hypothetical protein [Streptosporangium sp. OZ121]|uniref:hypothetical protein n=1 Tax=Streptosporangium sp. OZ121 TaxID=3444183 RepID=UPI003F795DCB